MEVQNTKNTITMGDREGGTARGLRLKDVTAGVYQISNTKIRQQ